MATENDVGVLGLDYPGQYIRVLQGKEPFSGLSSVIWGETSISIITSVYSVCVQRITKAYQKSPVGCNLGFHGFKLSASF